jgi:D-alanyl-D-alanine dipeptidase
MVSSTDSVGKSAVEIAATAPVTEPSDSLHNLQARKDLKNLPDTAFVDMIRYAEGFGYDMRYATANNFLDTAVYPCPTCKLRKEVADALVRANTSLQKQGVRIKFFDCYRPLDVQKQMWAVMPDGRYVANPYKSGSIHNRGAAVDISLETLAGKELDMGTGFDHFGKEAHHTYTQLPDTVLANRKLLKSEMEQAGFSALATEWWHYLYGSKSRYTLANESLCE